MLLTSPANRTALPALVLIGLLAGLTVTGCTRYVEADRGPQAYYQTGFPIHDTSGELERALESVKRIRVNTLYQTYLFDEATAPSETVRITNEVLATATDTVISDRSRAATAVLVAKEEGRLVLLTADHAVHFPDTIVERYGPEGAGVVVGETRTLRSVSVLTQRTNWVVGLPELDPFRVLARDEVNDLAFIGVEYGELPEEGGPRVLSQAPGRPDRLSWGSFVYVLGYPSGYPMVTRGIVSDPQGEQAGAFVIDGLWNEGMSGGLILAVRGDGSGMEWVGMARAAAARTEDVLVPEEGAHDGREPWMPYEGPIFLEEVRRIQYGITLSVPMHAIRRFADRHRSQLREDGYELPRF
jgi:hypothetical protein